MKKMLTFQEIAMKKFSNLEKNSKKFQKSNLEKKQAEKFSVQILTKKFQHILQKLNWLKLYWNLFWNSKKLKKHLIQTQNLGQNSGLYALTKNKNIAKNFPLTIFFCLFLTSCDLPETENMAPEHSHHSVSIRTWNNVNNRMALSIDLVQVYEKDVFSKIQTMDAKTFLSQKHQLKLDHPNGLNIWTVDFIDNDVKSFIFPTHHNFWGIVIFLHFINNPQNRIILPLDKHNVVLEISEGQFQIFPHRHSDRHNYIKLRDGDKYSDSLFGDSVE